MKHIFLLIGLLFTLLQGAQAQDYTIYYETVKSGNWNDASTWKNGKIPPTNHDLITDANQLKQTSHWEGISLKYTHHIVTIKEKDTVTMDDANFTIKHGGVLNIDTTGAFIVNKFRIYDGGFINVYGDFYIKEKLEQSWASNGSNIYVGEKGYIGVNGPISVGVGANFVNKGDVATTEGKISALGKVKNEGEGKVHFNQPVVIPRPNGFLPIELKSFVASARDGIVSFAWVTASEKNNDYFTIEQSTDLKNWEVIHRQQGAGNSFSELSYKAEKKLKGIGIFYFRLKQTDYDGQFSYSKIVSLSNNTLNEEVPSAFSESGEIVIRNTYEHLQVFNTQGRLLGTYSQTYRLNDLPKGILIFVFDKKHKQKIVNF